MPGRNFGVSNPIPNLECRQRQLSMQGIEKRSRMISATELRGMTCGFKMGTMHLNVRIESRSRIEGVLEGNVRKMPSPCNRCPLQSRLAPLQLDHHQPPSSRQTFPDRCLSF